MTENREVWVHKKSGGRYLILTEAVQEKDMEPVVVYTEATKADSPIFTRPKSEFFDGRFVREKQLSKDQFTAYIFYKAYSALCLTVAEADKLEDQHHEALSKARDDMFRTYKYFDPKNSFDVSIDYQKGRR
jgi:hypothetical protein